MQRLVDIPDGVRRSLRGSRRLSPSARGLPAWTHFPMDIRQVSERYAHLAPEHLAPHAAVLDRVLKAPWKTVELAPVPKRTP